MANDQVVALIIALAKALGLSVDACFHCADGIATDNYDFQQYECSMCDGAGYRFSRGSE